tara:strand:+ start:963 stop:1553 length:591 start_codon:yes stop_codon:yes gene_type:complete
MKIVHFFRHGETYWNLEGKFQGQQDIALTQKGIEQAQEMGELIKIHNCSIVLSSPLTRAIDTMNIAFHGSDIERVIHPSLIERDFGSLTGAVYSKALAEHKEIFDIMDNPNHPECYIQKLPGGESKGEVLLRVLGCVKDYTYEHRNIAVATHGGILQYIIMAKEGVFTHLKNGDLLSLSFDELDHIMDKVSVAMNP